MVRIFVNVYTKGSRRPTSEATRSMPCLRWLPTILEIIHWFWRTWQLMFGTRSGKRKIQQPILECDRRHISRKKVKKWTLGIKTILGNQGKLGVYRAASVTFPNLSLGEKLLATMTLKDTRRHLRNTWETPRDTDTTMTHNDPRSHAYFFCWYKCTWGCRAKLIWEKYESCRI